MTCIFWNNSLTFVVQGNIRRVMLLHRRFRGRLRCHRRRKDRIMGSNLAETHYPRFRALHSHRRKAHNILRLHINGRRRFHIISKLVGPHSSHRATHCLVSAKPCSTPQLPIAIDRCTRWKTETDKRKYVIIHAWVKRRGRPRFTVVPFLCDSPSPPGLRESSMDRTVYSPPIRMWAVLRRSPARKGIKALIPVAHTATTQLAHTWRKPHQVRFQ
jgi:hypothetical protein